MRRPLLLDNSFDQLQCAFLCRVIGAQFAAEGAGKDGFFDKVDLIEHRFGRFLGLLSLVRRSSRRRTISVCSGKEGKSILIAFISLKGGIFFMAVPLA